MLTWLASLLLILCLPPVLLSVALFFVSKYLKFSYRTAGYLKLRDIALVIENENFLINLRLDLFQIYLIWFRCRILLRGLQVKFLVKSRTFPSPKKQNINKQAYYDTFGKIST